MKRRKHMMEGLDEDIRDHLEREIQDNIERGMSPEEAQYAALRKFGNISRVREDTREVWSVVWLEQLLEDARIGIRMLWKSPELSVAAVLAITLGVGVNVGIFSVLNGVALRLLPIPRAEQIASVSQIFHGRTSRNTHGETSMFSYSEYMEYRDHNHVFTGLVAYEPFIEASPAGAAVQRVLGAAASCNYFDVLDEHPAHGRAFVDSDCAAPGESAAVVVSDDLWRGRFAADPSFLGKRIILNRRAYTVIGIARPGFGGTDLIPSAFWVPITMQKALEPGQDRLADDNMSWLALLGRIKTGISLEQIRTDLGVIAGRIDHLHPGRRTSLAVHIARFLGSPEEREVLLPISSVILVAFGLILLLACANVANLLLARASVRYREIALRQAMGASRWRLVRQMLTESLMLSLVGGGLGSMLAFLCLPTFMRFVISHLPRPFPTVAVNVSPDVHVIGYAFVLTLITGVAFGLAPALQNSRFELNAALKEGGAYFDFGNRRRRLLRNVLVGAQIAFSMVLLLAAGLLLRGLYHAQTVDPGFDTKNVAAIFLNLREQGYDVNRATAFMRRLRERATGLPGVVEVAQAECAPLSHDFSADYFAVPGRLERFPIEYNHVSREYFSVIGVPIVAGHGFSGEGHTAPGVIVTESTAQRLWPGENPLTRTLREDPGREYSVIGVAKDAQVSHLGELKTSYLYFPAGPEDNSRTYLLVRFRGNLAVIANSLRNAVQSLDRDLPVAMTRLEDYLDVWCAPSRLFVLLSGALSALALLLASIGVYGMTSYTVNRSVREIGIRMAVGANGTDIISHILWEAMCPILIGSLIGIVLSAAVSRVLSSLLFGLSAHDAVAFISVPLFLLAVAIMASLIPARRAMRVDPMVALRFE
ncbi:MAG: ABC transporter permease [Bryobacteraceae bacterium]